MNHHNQHLIFEPFQTDLAFRGLQEFGCVLLKNQFPSQWIQELNKRAQFVFNLREQERLQGTLPEGYKYHYDYGFVTYLGIRELDLPTELPYQVLRIFQQLPLMNILAKVFQETIAVNLSHSIVRHSPVGYEHLNLQVPFHQDGPLRGSCSEVPVMNCWIPLTACGKDAPSLEILPVGLQYALPLQELRQDVHKMYQNIALKPEQVYQQFNHKQFWQVEMEVGDVLLMDQHVVHRTHLNSNMIQDRFSMEIRVVPSSQVPIDLKSMGFVDIFNV